MSSIFKAVFLILILLPLDTLGKPWKGIVPLHSTHADVERILGTPVKKNSHYSSYFSLPKEIVLITYQAESCNEGIGQFGHGWNVPVGTVISIGVIPKLETRKETFMRGGDFKVDPAGAGFVYYSDDTNGFLIETYRNKVSLLEYRPKKAEHNMRCPKVMDGVVESFSIFDAYGDISFADEKARLDNYAFQVSIVFDRGVIVFYSADASTRRKWLARAERAKDYLVNKHGIEPQRVLIVDGGYKPDPYIELRYYGIGGEVSRISLFVDKAPVQAKPNKSPHWHQH